MTKRTRVINAFRLILEHKLKLTQTIEFQDIELDEDGILILDLRSAKVSARSANHYRRHRKKTVDGKYPISLVASERSGERCCDECPKLSSASRRSIE